MNMNENNNLSNQDPNRKKRNRINIIICIVAAVFAMSMIMFLNAEIQRNTQKEITYTKFIDMMKEGKVKKVTFKSNMIVIEPKTEQKAAMFKVTYYTGYVNDTSLVQNMLEKYNVEFSAEIEDTSSGILDILLTYVLPIVVLWGLFWFLMRSATKGGGLMGSVGKSNAKMYVEKKTGVTFADVAGEEEAKESLTELVELDPGWLSSSRNLADMIKEIRKGNTEGYVLFDYSSLYRDVTQKEVKNYLAEITSFRLSRTKKTLKTGKKFKLSVRRVWPSRVQGKIRFKSSNKKIATVNKKGVVKARKKAGKVKITVYYGKKKKVCKVIVRKAKKKK